MTSITTAPLSPSSSPRLPSPPPLTEVQFGPRSPSLSNAGAVAAKDRIDFSFAGIGTGKATRRIRPGTTSHDMASGPPFVPLRDLDSAFQLQEYLQSLYVACTQPPELAAHTVPITAAAAAKLAMPPDGVDRSLWLYELCRLLTNKLNTFIVAFFADSPPCSAATCPEMRASEWQYLCAVHDPPKPCCAIDYSCHTLDWAASMLTSTKHFPSRLSLGINGSGHNDGHGSSASSSSSSSSGSAPSSASGQQQGLRSLTNIFRRLYRIFAHAWYQHRAVFWQVESQTGLYLFFKTVCDVYHLMPDDNYTIPPEAEGAAAAAAAADEDRNQGGSSGSSAPWAPAPTVLKRPQTQVRLDASAAAEALLSASSTTNPGLVTTRRHTAFSPTSPSAGAVPTVPEENEDEASDRRPSLEEAKPGQEKRSGVSVAAEPEGPDAEERPAAQEAASTNGVGGGAQASQSADSSEQPESTEPAEKKAEEEEEAAGDGIDPTHQSGSPTKRGGLSAEDEGGAPTTGDDNGSSTSEKGEAHDGDGGGGLVGKAGGQEQPHGQEAGAEGHAGETAGADDAQGRVSSSGENASDGGHDGDYGARSSRADGGNADDAGTVDLAAASDDPNTDSLAAVIDATAGNASAKDSQSHSSSTHHDDDGKHNDSAAESPSTTASTAPSASTDNADAESATASRDPKDAVARENDDGSLRQPEQQQEQTGAVAGPTDAADDAQEEL